MARQSFASVALFVAAFASQAGAQTRASAGVLAEMDRYRLTMEDARKYVRANANLTQLEKTNPGLQARTQPDSGLVMPSARPPYVNTSELERTERNITSNPLLLKAVQSAGLTPRQYVLANWIFFFDAVVVQMMSMPEPAAKKIFQQAHIHPDNMLFLKQHKGELEALGKRGG